MRLAALQCPVAHTHYALIRPYPVRNIWPGLAAVTALTGRGVHLPAACSGLRVLGQGLGS